MITLIIIVIVQTLIIAVSIKKGIKQLNRANYWKDEYIKAQKRNKMTERGEELLQQLTDCDECGQSYPITGDLDMDDRIRRTQEHNNNKSKLEDEIDELKRKVKYAERQGIRF